MKKVNKSMGLGSIILSFFFLFNPNMNLIDVLPDVIGYAILCRGLVYIADLNETCSSALTLFKRMILVDAFKWVTLFGVFGLSSGDERNTSLLLMSFVFALLEMFFLIPAYRDLFDGLMQLGYKYDNDSVMAKRSAASRKNFTEKIKGFTYVFVTVKTLMYTLPEFSVLSSQSYDESSSTRTIELYDFVGLLRSVALLIALVFGIIWLVRVVRYFKRIRADRVLIGALEKEYTETILPKTSLFIQRDIKGVFWLLGFAALLCVDMRADSFNFLPDVLPAAILIVSAFLAKKYVLNFKKYIVPLAVYGVCATVSTVIEIIFFDKYYYGAVIRSEEAFAFYCVMLVFAVIEAASFLYATHGVIYILRGVIDGYTGFSMPNADGVVTQSAQERIKGLHRELYRKLYYVCGAAILLVASDLFYDFGAKDLGFAGIINVVCSFIFFAVMYSALNSVYEEVQSKYMLD